MAESANMEDVFNVTTKPRATVEGIAIAYGSLVIMALVPIFVGSYRSVEYLKKKKESGEPLQSTTLKEVLMCPLYASGVLLFLYVKHKAEVELKSRGEVLPDKELSDPFVTAITFSMALALTRLLSPIVTWMMPSCLPNVLYHIHFTRGRQGSDERTDIINYKYTSHDVVALVASLCFGGWYLAKKHWIANNIFGLAAAINAVEMAVLNKMAFGCILMCCLFIYDIFWVFGTDVMLTVAQNFDAPIKLLFPGDLPINGLAANNFSMLGLGDIILPGIFIALLLRIDRSLQRNSDFYFRATFSAYIIGLLGTIVVMHVYQTPQPALLYLVPVCLGTPLTLAFLKGDVKALFAYEDQPAIEEPAADTSKTEKVE